jgi:hypothetical protein
MLLTPKLLNISATMNDSASPPDRRQHNVTKLNRQRRPVVPPWMGLSGSEVRILLLSHYCLMEDVSIPMESLHCMLIIENRLLILIS